MHKPILLAALVAAGCSESDSSSMADGAVAVDAPAGLGPCPSGTLCLDPFLVEAQKPVAAGRLVVVWFQPMRVNGLPPMPIEIAYDVPFVPNLRRYDIPLAQVRAPIADQVLLCQWDSLGCHRDAPIPAVGFALPVVVADTNANGRTDLDEVSFFSNYGGGMAYIAWSKLAHPVGSTALAYNDGDLTYLGQIFRKGIGAGVQSYNLMPQSFANALDAPDTGDGSDLALCPNAGTSCQVTMPRVVGADNP